MLKIAQFILAALVTDWPSVASLTPLHWVFFAVFVTAGQILNARVYFLLGEVGVYYGARFGRHVAWVTQWPYSSIRDPQYIGCILSAIGFSVILPLKVRSEHELIYR